MWRVIVPIGDSMVVVRVRGVCSALGGGLGGEARCCCFYRE